MSEHSEEGQPASPPSLSKDTIQTGMEVRVKSSLVGEGSVLRGKTGRVVRVDVDDGRATVQFSEELEKTLPVTTLRKALPSEALPPFPTERQKSEEVLVSELTIPKTASMYTGQKQQDSPATSRRAMFKSQKKLSLSGRKKRLVSFIDAVTQNTITLRPSDKGVGIVYKVNGADRPDTHTIKFEAGSRKLRFIDINKGVTLPEGDKLLDDIRKLAVECKVWNNLPKPKIPPVVVKLRTGNVVGFVYEKGGVLSVLDGKGKRVQTVRNLEFDAERLSLVDGKGNAWKVVKDQEHVASVLRKLYNLCEEMQVPHHLEKLKRKGRIWVKPITRFGLRTIAIKSIRRGGDFVDVKLLKEITRWCGMYDTDPLHILVVLWGFGDVMESRHVRASKGVHATPGDIHKKLTSDKRWLEARSSDFTFDSQAVYYLGPADASVPSFSPRALLPGYPLVTQGYSEGSGDALHIISTSAADHLATFKSKSRRIHYSNIKAADCSGISSQNGRAHDKDCAIM